MAISIIEQTARPFTADLLELARMTAEMGGCAEAHIVRAADALQSGNPELPRRVIREAARLAAQQRAIDQKCIETLATQQPVAMDLREIVAILQIASNLARIGELGTSVARRAALLNARAIPRKTLQGIIHMTALVLDLLREALDSYCHRDSRKAVTVRQRDQDLILRDGDAVFATRGVSGFTLTRPSLTVS